MLECALIFELRVFILEEKAKLILSIIMNREIQVGECWVGFKNSSWILLRAAGSDSVSRLYS